MKKIALLFALVFLTLPAVGWGQQDFIDLMDKNAQTVMGFLGQTADKAAEKAGKYQNLSGSYSLMEEGESVIYGYGKETRTAFYYEGKLSISKKGNQHKVKIDTINSYGHTCSIEGTGQVEGDILNLKVSNNGETKILPLLLGEDNITVENGGYWFSSFCGVRGYYWGTYTKDLMGQ